jgi:hypothetical protein
MKKNPVARPRIIPSATVLKAHEGTPVYGDYGYPPDASATPVRLPDRRAEGGNVYDLTSEQTAL